MPATRLQPVAGSPGVYRATFDVPAGNYEYKVALNNSWDENYGAGGAPGGANIPITAPGGPVMFTYDHATHVITDDAPRPLQAVRGAHWLRGADRLAPARGRADLPAALRARGRARDRGRRDRRRRVGAARARRGRAAGRRARAVPAPVVVFGAAALVRRAALAPELLKGELVVAAYDGAGALLGVTGVQIPGVLDELYASAARAELGAGLERPQARPPTLARRLGADGQGRRAAARPRRRRAGAAVAMRRGDDGVWRVGGDPSWRDAAYRYEVRVYVPTLDKVVTNARHRSVLRRADDELRALRARRPRRPGARAERLARAAQARAGAPEDATIDELHIRDFSITDETVPAAHRGTYLAFTDRHSDGMRHLRDLARGRA